MAGPWEAYQENKDQKPTGAKPWEAYSEKATPSGEASSQPKTGGGGLWSSAADFFKSIPRGLAGATRAPGAFGTQGVLEAPDEKLKQTTAKAAEQLHQPEGFAGRVGERTGAAMTDPTTFVPLRGAVRTGASIVGGIVGGQAGQDIGGTAGGIVGGAIGGLAGGTSIRTDIPPATRGVIRDAAEAAYDTVKNSPRKIPLEETSLLSEKLRDKLNQEGVYREAPEGVAVFKTLDRLNSAVNASHITPAEVHSITKTLQKIGSSNPGNATGRAAGIARSEIFSWLEQFPELKEAIGVGNANWRALKTSEALGTAQEKGQLGAQATVTGDNIDRALRSQIRQMYFSKKVYKTPEEEALMKSIVEGDTTSNIGKRFAKLKTPLRHLASAVMHAKGAGILNHGAEWLLKGVANRNTERQIGKLDEAVRWTAPASGQRPAPSSQMSRGQQRAVQAGRGGSIGADKKRPNVYEE